MQAAGEPHHGQPAFLSALLTCDKEHSRQSGHGEVIDLGIDLLANFAASGVLRYLNDCSVAAA